MKYLLIFLVVLIGVWRWRISRLEKQHTIEKKKSASKPQTMLVCHQCGVHLPANEAVRGQKGDCYCSAAHRQKMES